MFSAWKKRRQPGLEEKKGGVRKVEKNGRNEFQILREGVFAKAS